MCFRCHDNWLFIWFRHVKAGTVWTMYIAQSAPWQEILFYSFYMNAHRSTYSCVRSHKQIYHHIKTETFPRGNFAHWDPSISSSSFFPIHFGKTFHAYANGTVLCLKFEKRKTHTNITFEYVKTIIYVNAHTCILMDEMKSVRNTSSVNLNQGEKVWNVNVNVNG